MGQSRLTVKYGRTYYLSQAPIRAHSAENFGARSFFNSGSPSHSGKGLGVRLLASTSKLIATPVLARINYDDARNSRESSEPLRNKGCADQIHADAVSAGIPHRLDRQQRPDAAVPLPAAAGRNDLSARKARAVRHSRRRLHLLFRHHRASRGASRLRHLQAETRRYRGLRRARRDRRRGHRQLRRVVRRPGPRGRPDAAGGVGAHRRRTRATLSRTRTAHRDAQPFSARSAPSRVAQHDARARGARSRREWRSARVSAGADGVRITSRPCARAAPTS